MARRIHVQHLRPDEPVALARAEAHHARNVLRLADGTRVEVFDDAGAAGEGVLTLRGADAFVRVERADLQPHDSGGAFLSIAAAVPKGDRADWMVEKLSELGVAEWIPLAAARSVVLPGGKGKRDRWLRIAIEAAKQSRRAGVMRITHLTPLGDALAQSAPRTGARRAWFLSTEIEDATPIAHAIDALPPGVHLSAFIGPEGGWTAQEQQQFLAAGATPVRLSATILRVETAAVTTAAVVACVATPDQRGDAPGARLDGPAARDDDPATNDAPTTGTPP